ncbi:MAG: diaminohydroxyphosphoribosylaminopyrimidine deaminase [Actinomycetota bacterium]|jgi:diaminohydroxyphosphoribosylaminopyrimidine deaminase/5-amino-6-(5-phosphoribosylamino)uracil reductase|nr:diaminohydroxyphosphoribosylaminopyrimidine deaminase [Actinomycetota bacterium]
MDDERFMRRALDLAAEARFTSPNPRVGAVVVRDGEILSEGFHRGLGTSHAESVALNGIDATGATVYVNLEPCNHHASTPPCSEALVAAGVSRVVTALSDPDPRVAGGGIEHLRSNGVHVDVGILAADAAALNRAYLYHRSTGKSFIHLKLAQTIDGRLASADGSARWITGADARRRVHEYRARVDAVMVGAGTVVADDPTLTARDVGAERQPLRIVVDSSGRTRPDAKVYQPDAPTLLVTTDSCSHERQVAFKEKGVEVLIVPEQGGRVDLAVMVEELGRRGVVEVLCEGGAELASSLLRGELVGRLEIHTGPVVVGGGPSLDDLGLSSLERAPRWLLDSAEAVGDDVISVYLLGAN